ncbi:unnamed protein product, partial [Didymodactylos carnosus]
GRRHGGESKSSVEPLNYTTYLGLVQLLSSMKCLSRTDPTDENSPHQHDEHFFILIHQVFELWFKQFLFEIDSIRAIFAIPESVNHNMYAIISRLQRCTTIWRMLIDQLELLETMTPGAFLEFRDYVTPASGFQSLQFRIIENKLGLTDKSRSVYKMNHFTDQMFTRRVQAEELKKSMEEKSLLMLLEKWLENIYDSITSLDFLNEYKLGVERFIDHEVEKEKNSAKDENKAASLIRKKFDKMINKNAYDELLSNNQRRMSQKAMLAALMISIYHEEPCFHEDYQLLYLLMDIDSLIASWRRMCTTLIIYKTSLNTVLPLEKHVLLVQRQIGSKQGTGGTGGLIYLNTTLR